MHKQLFFLFNMGVTCIAFSQQEAQHTSSVIHQLTKNDINYHRTAFIQWVNTDRPPRYVKLYLLLNRLPLYLLHTQNYMKSATIEDIAYSIELLQKFYADDNTQTRKTVLQNFGNKRDLQSINDFYLWMVQNEQEGSDTLSALDRVRDQRRAHICKYLELPPTASKEELKNCYKTLSLKKLSRVIVLDKFNYFLFKLYTNKHSILSP